MSFKDVKFGPHESELRFRLIHFWEARNVRTKLLIGLSNASHRPRGNYYSGLHPSWEDGHLFATHENWWHLQAP
ncbi:unnamed protein product [Brassica napus]|uniref:(rape) hypothetical protein n=1 Tax=Brassica napus TaxID=3708 RepID=A0A816XBJ7_BRANA|nr:unnamed protein product [Brassica napus]